MSDGAVVSDGAFVSDGVDVSVGVDVNDNRGDVSDGAGEAGSGGAGGRWEGAEALVAAAVCGIEVLSGTGLSYRELKGKVAALWGLLLPSLVGEARAGEYRTCGEAGAGDGGGLEALGFVASGG
ncbi:hypothetical protein ADK55_14460 [Streptomyces sp. WM4235]|nr:hypothetical protein ADK55_14460 [Streptomyces sp. WM4235]